jgi:hypothetical protein
MDPMSKQERTMKLFAAVLLAAVTLGGCAVVPVPVHGHGHGYSQGHSHHNHGHRHSHHWRR